MNDPLMTVLKKVNFIFGKGLDEKELIKHRKFIERLGQLAAPKDDLIVEAFSVGDINCESVIIPNTSSSTLTEADITAAG